MCHVHELWLCSNRSTCVIEYKEVKQENFHDRLIKLTSVENTNLMPITGQHKFMEEIINVIKSLASCEAET